MSYQRDRWEFVHFYMKWASLDGGKTEGDLQREAVKLLRYAATHIRIETELTNGYKDCNGNQDMQRTQLAIAKRDRIDAKMEAIAAIEYGALAISVKLGNREFYIPTRRG